MRPFVPTRRAVLAGFGAVLLIRPAEAAQAPGEKTRAAMKALGLEGAKPDERLSLNAPDVAENGADVEIGFSFAGEGVHARRIALFAEKNPESLLGEYAFSPRTGRKARVVARLRLMETQEVVAAAELSDGSKIMTAARLVKVAIGACGGG